MARKPSGGDFRHRVAFDAKQTGNPDSPADYGNTQTDWVQQTVCRAGYKHLRGGERVMAGRLEGRHAQIVTVYRSASTLAITTDWRMRDLNNGSWVGQDWAGPIYAVRDISPNESNQYLDILVESGVAP